MNQKPDIIVAYTHSVGDGGIRVHTLPKPGETVRALESGGGTDGAKGTNVAVAASKVGASVALVANVKGGEWLTRGQAVLEENRIDSRFVVCQPGTRRISGCILIDDEGRNMIVLGSGGEQAIPRQQVDEAFAALGAAKYCVTGYELNKESAEYIVRSAKAIGMKTILNPSPVPDARPDFWHLVDVLVLNETEAAHMRALAGTPVAGCNWPAAAAKLQESYGCANVVITLGPEGFYCLDELGLSAQDVGDPSFVPRDTTGAGDAFLGVMAACLAAGQSLGDACARANQYSGYTVEHSGTISSYPGVEELQKRLPFEPPFNAVR